MAFAKLNSMKFVGLNGLKHFWTKAKTWITGQITAEVTAKIAELVANAPEDLDTLKEIADWIKTHANDASAMNTAILANTEAISGKADKNHTHTKSEITDFPTSLPANGGTADKATSANLSKTLDTVNGDKLQIGSGTAQNVTNAKHAVTADAFSTTYISNITPAQAAAMKSESTIWPLSYNKNYLQTVSVTWDDYSFHTFPAGSAGMFFPGYSSNGGTLILIDFVASRMLYNVWIDSNRWSGWHYIDLPAISYT